MRGLPEPATHYFSCQTAVIGETMTRLYGEPIVWVYRDPPVTVLPLTFVTPSSALTRGTPCPSAVDAGLRSPLSVSALIYVLVDDTQPLITTATLLRLLLPAGAGGVCCCRDAMRRGGNSPSYEIRA
ncbi:hypothetical protein E2C01_000283 [Portunus trituberculatus]|uniref:Uncharacterized protein n=1 Tax=Portunus trituberculatus TaxID=210409 RepID=A0A5B7CE94_PORTR|nr:hypothetical protein [Portunus trituberculatus]